MVYDGWCRGENWPILKAPCWAQSPRLFAWQLPQWPGAASRNGSRGMVGAAFANDNRSITRGDIGAFAALLGKGHWLVGGRISSANVTVYSLLASIIFMEFSSPMKVMIEAHPGIIGWLGSVQATIYSGHILIPSFPLHKRALPRHNLSQRFPSEERTFENCLKTCNFLRNGSGYDRWYHGPCFSRCSHRRRRNG